MTLIVETWFPTPDGIEEFLGRAWRQKMAADHSCFENVDHQQPGLLEECCTP